MASQAQAPQTQQTGGIGATIRRLLFGWWEERQRAAMEAAAEAERQRQEMLAWLDQEFAEVKPVVVKKEAVSTGAARAGMLTTISHAVSFGKSFITVDLAPADRPRGHLSQVEAWARYRPAPNAPEQVLHFNMLSGTRWSVLESSEVGKFELEADTQRTLPPNCDVRLYIRGEVTAEAGQQQQQHTIIKRVYDFRTGELI
jgi:hypothetical protein